MQPGDELTYDLFANTKELSPETLSSLAEVAPGGRLVFTGEPAQLAAIARGKRRIIDRVYQRRNRVSVLERRPGGLGALLRSPRRPLPTLVTPAPK